MQQYFFFSLFLLGIFSIIENIKGYQSLTKFKLNILIFLALVSILSLLDFLEEFGFIFIHLKSITRVFGILSFINLFYLIALHKIPKLVIIIEILIVLFYIFIIFNGFEFERNDNGLLSKPLSTLSLIAFFINTIFSISSMAYNLITIFIRTDKNNLHQLKIRNWSILLIIFFFIILASIFLSVMIYYNKFILLFFSTEAAYIIIRFTLILFILLRPRFLDDSGFNLKLSDFKPTLSSLSVSKFEFLFFANQYFLKTEANLDDFSLKINHSRTDVNEFIKNHFQLSFNDLLNKNRLYYFKDLLKSNHHDSFTIEALSEMSGFNNRQSMYNAFKKYENSSPREYINNL